MLAVARVPTSTATRSSANEVRAVANSSTRVPAQTTARANSFSRSSFSANGTHASMARKASKAKTRRRLRRLAFCTEGFRATGAAGFGLSEASMTGSGRIVFPA